MSRETKKAVLYVYRESDNPSEPSEWVKTNVELDINQGIQKLSWRTIDEGPEQESGWGSNSVTMLRGDMNEVVGKLLTLCDAMISDETQRDAWKKLVRQTIHNWFDGKHARYQLEQQFKGDQYNQ